MGKLSTGIVTLAIIMALTAAIMAPAAAASLVQTTFGFPILVRSGQSASFNNDVASFTGSEIMDINFNLFDGMMSQAGAPEIRDMGMNDWSMQGMAMPDLSHMASLFDFPGFMFH